MTPLLEADRKLLEDVSYPSGALSITINIPEWEKENRGILISQ